MTLALCLTGNVGGGTTVAAPWSQDTPVTPGATAETQSLLAFLGDNYGRHVIAGQQDGWSRRSGESYELNYVRNTTGKLPALTSFEMGNLTPLESPDTEINATRYAREWHSQSNGLVSFCWHWSAPNSPGKFYSKDTWFDLEKALVPGSDENAALLRDLDLAAAQLAILRDARVPVLWRPLHEMNGRWFWWGDHGPKALRQLWQLMYDRFTNKHKLNNLLWVFSPGASVDLSEWYPGDAYVDIIGYDHYTIGPSLAPAKNVFDELNALVAHGKMLAMSENGQLPDLDLVFQEKAVWSYFTTWSGDLVRKTPTNQLAAIYNDARVLTVDELPDLKTYPFRSAGAATKLVLLTPDRLPSNGSSPRPVTVQLKDKKGLTVRENGRVVKLTADGKTLSANTINGIATFEDLKLDCIGKSPALKASSKGLRSVSSKSMEVGPGDGLVFEWWTNLTGFSVADLKNESSRPEFPAGRELLAEQFRVSYQPSTNYGARIHGWLIAPVSGNYEFALVSDGASQLWLGLEDKPEGEKMIAEITGATPYSKWPHSHEVRSVPITLQAGKAYRIEALHVLKSGGNGLTVRWRLPSATADEIIPAYQVISKPLTNSRPK